MDGKNRITLVLIDTCAFRDANSDFLGIVKKLLPSFFSAIDEKGIVLLTHPILENEVHKHIEDSSLYKDYQLLVAQLRKCADTLKHIEYTDEVLFSKISEIDIRAKLFEAYQQYYHHAIHLDFGDPSSVFALYFSGKPPFAVSGKKKNEFPDAFIFDATKRFLEDHPNDILLIVSKDKDWITAFAEVENVIISESIADALTQISSIDSILSPEMLNDIFHGAYEEILADAYRSIECENFELENYETIDELEIESIKVESVSDVFTPLKITRDNLLISTYVTLKVSGHAEVFDDDNSIWDSVDREYIFVSYADLDFTDIEVEVECEILISFDFDNPESTAQVDSFKLLNQGNICIFCDEASISQINEDELAIRSLREDMGYPRRNIH